MKLNKKQRAELKQKFGGHCAYCGIELGDKYHADHILPVRRDFRWVKNEETGNHVAKANGVLLNPENDCFDNLNPSCVACNINKGCADLESWRKLLENYVNGLNEHGQYSIYRHAKRFGLIVETHKPVVFFFERFKGQDT